MNSIELLPEKSLCAECGRRFNPADLLSFDKLCVCGECKDVFFQRVRERGIRGAVKTAFQYGGFWIRFAARVIDGLIISAVFFVLMFLWVAVLEGSMPRPGEVPNLRVAAKIWAGLALIYFFSTAFFVVYEAWFLAKRQGTPGKLALGLRVTRSDGENLTSGRSTGRAFAYLLSSLMPLAIGLVIAAFDEEKRALHDHICDTRVVRHRPVSSSANALSPGDQGPPISPQLVVAEEAGCFFHPLRVAIHTCSRCGRFLCPLCRISWTGEDLCVPCVEFASRGNDSDQFASSRFHFDSLALALSTLGILTGFFSLVTAPLALGLSLFTFRKQSSVVPRSRIRFFVAIFFSLATITGWIILLTYAFRRAGQIALPLPTQLL